MILLLVDQVFENLIILYYFNTKFVKKIKIHIEIVKSNLQEKSSFSNHSKREFLKYEILKFSIFISKNLAKIERIIPTNLESGIKTLEQRFKSEEDFNPYKLRKLELENIYDKKCRTCENP